MQRKSATVSLSSIMMISFAEALIRFHPLESSISTALIIPQSTRKGKRKYPVFPHQIKVFRVFKVRYRHLFYAVSRLVLQPVLLLLAVRFQGPASAS
jgi:hypothetical protein